ncbi:hypothetical protein MYSTI_00497 [Myxococcus stipitatus DSM 14675]|uniref:B box-type domain-containing protein n=1 Tax=Myxococcus stipitatus (strain DSM 14675 / JCM 12634 / Mx s8) TaxID=1278073 RepID=L7U2N1_MYXSD|nr:hypothetical protein [Myxococcus stipitatus]AGC41847.1 hypothetical protein MYSTI_00497 [Myxococcus stipitatus DSM 14675]
MRQGLEARCASHAQATAVATCARCGGFLCGECLEVEDAAPYCEPCLAWRRRNERASGLAWAVMVLGCLAALTVLLLVPVAGYFFFGGNAGWNREAGFQLIVLLTLLLGAVSAPALVLGLWEGWRIRQRKSPRGGQRFVRLGTKLGGAGLALFVCEALYAVYVAWAVMSVSLD